MYRRIQEKVAGSEVDAFLVQNAANLNWVCHKENYYLPGVMLVTPDETHVFTPSRNLRAFVELYPELRMAGGGLPEVAALCAAKNIRRLGFEADTVSWRQHKDLEAMFNGVELVPLSDFVEDLRMCKTPAEVELIQEAARLSDACFAEFLNHLRVGLTELQAKNILRSIFFDRGADDLSFDILISSGPRTFLPHSASTDREIRRGDLVLMDYGIVLNGYCSDTTRTVVMGEATELQQKRYALVLKAQENALRNIKAGVTLQQADAFARDVITAEEKHGCFDYGLGHGIGRLVHEKPRMHPKHTAPMLAGAIVSVEPGLYVEGWGGIRIEDLLVVGKENPGRNLTGAPKKELMVL